MAPTDSQESGTASRLSGSAQALPFLTSWLRNPVAVGLPFVSSPATSMRLAEIAAGCRVGRGPILELGGGTGAVTSALLELGCPAEQLIVVERDAGLCQTLQQRFPRLRLLRGDALELAALFGGPSWQGVLPFSVVLCGLPMRAVPPGRALRCYAEAFDLMRPGGSIVQYTYGFRAPVEPQDGGPASRRLRAEFVAREWRNVPPVGIWRYRSS